MLHFRSAAFAAMLAAAAPLCAQTIGLPTPGTTAYPDAGMRYLQTRTLASGEDSPRCISIDPAGDFAVAGCYNTTPGHAVKIRLSDFSRVGGVDFSTNENDPRCSVIDSTGTFAYFGTYTLPGRVVKVRMSDFTRVGALSFDNLQNENFLSAAVIDPAGAFAYFGCDTNPGVVVKVDLSTFTKVGRVAYSNLEDQFRCLAMDPSGSHVYAGTFGGLGKVGKLTTDPFARIFSTLSLAAAEAPVRSLAISPLNPYLYAGTGNSPARIVKMRRGEGNNLPFKIATTVLPAGEDIPASALAAADSEWVAFGLRLAPNPGKIVKLRPIEDGTTAAAVRLGALTLPADVVDIQAAALHPSGTYGVFGADTYPGKLVRVAMSQNGFIKATRATNPAQATVSAVKFHAHAARGSVRLAVYTTATTSARVWESGEVAIAESGTVTVPASFALAAGDYWLAWQVSSSAEVPSYTAGASGDGFLLEQPFGAFPSQIAAAARTSTSERWTMWLDTSAPTATPTPTPTPSPTPSPTPPPTPTPPSPLVDADGDGLADGFETAWGGLPGDWQDVPPALDLDGNGGFDARDAVIYFRMAAGVLPWLGPTINPPLDFNHDGENTAADALMMWENRTGGRAILN